MLAHARHEGLVPDQDAFDVGDRVVTAWRAVKGESEFPRANDEGVHHALAACQMAYQSWRSSGMSSALIWASSRSSR